MSFSSVIDMHMAGNQRQRHMFVKATSQNYAYIHHYIHHLAPMGSVSGEQEYPANALEIIVLALTKAK